MLLVLFYFIVSSFSLEYPCKYRSSDGDFYDLTPLTSVSGYTVNPGLETSYTLNVCGDLSECSGAGVCQNGIFDCGHASSASFSDIGKEHDCLLTITFCL
jgi:hypothetical protein